MNFFIQKDRPFVKKQQKGFMMITGHSGLSGILQNAGTHVHKTKRDSGQAGMTNDGIFFLVRLTVQPLLPIIMFFFISNSLPNTLKPTSESTGSFPSCAYAADEPQFIKEGQLKFLDKKSRTAIATIDIEIADSDYERTQGLMYRHTLPYNAGMLFIFERSEQRSFWMRNTYIPLDIIFADGNRQIVTIEKNTKPLSYAQIPSRKNAKYVIEVNAGFCDKYRIAVGDHISF